MASFDWKKNIEDFTKDRLIITATTTGIFYVLKAADIKPPKVSLDAMNIMRLAGGICGGVLVKDYAVYKKWATSEYNNKNFIAPRGHKINTTRLILLILRSKPRVRIVYRCFDYTSYRHFSIIKALFFNG